VDISKRKIKRGRELPCDDCHNLYQELCIPKYHKILCHNCYKEENTENSADELLQVEENDASDINELYMLATQK
jgi:hypothetical protein